MTSEELFALRPSKKVDRWLFRGELRESKVTKRNPSHSGTTARISYLLISWLEKQPKPRGKVFDGEAYFRIRKDPDTNVGIDVALAPAELVAATGKKASFLDGIPVLAVEVLSPYDKMKEIDDALVEYLACGIPLVWVVNPYAETVTVYRPGSPPVLFNTTQELSGEPVLPGFAVAVSALFE
jgi:Uma2 family endonuclease